VRLSALRVKDELGPLFELLHMAEGGRTPAPRVVGNFPLRSDDALFSHTWLEEAKPHNEGDGELFAGLDVGGPGEDETALCLRRGPKIVKLMAWTEADPWGNFPAPEPGCDFGVGTLQNEQLFEFERVDWNLLATC
jgi:hypothetical protein